MSLSTHTRAHPCCTKPHAPCRWLVISVDIQLLSVPQFNSVRQKNSFHGVGVKHLTKLRQPCAVFRIFLTGVLKVCCDYSEHHSEF